MARFTIHTNEKKKRRRWLFTYLYIIGGLLCLSVTIFFGDRKIFKIANLVIGVNAAWIGIDSYRNMGKVLFAEINERAIQWLVYEKSTSPVLIEWNDVRWIKKEKNGSISIFQDSSFSKNLVLKDFTEDDQKEINLLFERYSVQKQIRLVNFEEPSLALA